MSAPEEQPVGGHPAQRKASMSSAVPPVETERSSLRVVESSNGKTSTSQVHPQHSMESKRKSLDREHQAEDAEKLRTSQRDRTGAADAVKDARVADANDRVSCTCFCIDATIMLCGRCLVLVYVRPHSHAPPPMRAARAHVPLNFRASSLPPNSVASKEHA